MVRLGLPCRLVGMLLTEVLLLLCFKRCGSERRAVNAGRAGILNDVVAGG